MCGRESCLSGSLGQVPTRLPLLWGFGVYLLYLDASGTVLAPNENYIVLAGVAIFERQITYAVNALDEIAATINPHHPEEIELHGSVMYSAREEYRRLGQDVSRNLISEGLSSALNATH